MTLETAIAEYLDSLEGEGRSPRTLDAYRRDLKRLVAVLGAERDVGSVTPPVLLAFAREPVVTLKADGTARHLATVNRTRTAVRGLFGFLTRSWAIDRDPSRVLRVKAARPARPSVLSREDEVKLLAAMDAAGTWTSRRDSLMVRLLLATGIRLSSLVALDVGDVDLDNERLWIASKGGKRLVVRLSAELGRELLAQAGDGPLFQGRTGRRIGPRQVQLRLAKWVQRAEIVPVSVHGLRHTYAGRLYRETKDLRVVQRALGHASVLTTERYVGA